MTTDSRTFNVGFSASTPGSGSFTFGCYASKSDENIVFLTGRRKHYIKQRCRIGSHRRRNDASVSVQASANPIFDIKSSTSNISTSVALTTTVSPNGLLANIAPGPVHSSSAVVELSSETKSDPEKENMSCISLPSPVEVKENMATREENQAPVSNSPLPLTMVSRILNGIPQHPHFYQLRNCSELTRKKLISAWDRTFEETVKEIHSLQDVDRFWVRSKELWKTMEELQNVGYNVIPLRRRLVELTDIMLERKMSQREINGLKIKAENHRMEKSRLESVILNLQALAKKEENSMECVLIKATKLEGDLPKFSGVLAELAMEPL